MRYRIEFMMILGNFLESKCDHHNLFFKLNFFFYIFPFLLNYFSGTGTRFEESLKNVFVHFQSSKFKVNFSYGFRGSIIIAI